MYFFTQSMKWNNSIMYFLFSFSYFLYKKINDDSTSLTQKERCLDKYSKKSLFFERPLVCSLSHSLLLFLSHCYILRGDLYSNTTHIYVEYRECFGVWEAFGICQKKPVRLGECNQAVLWDLDN